MATKEEIREMVKHYLVGCIHGARVSYDDISGYDRSTVDFEAEELLGELHKLGVVIGSDYIIGHSISIPEGTKLTATEPLVVIESLIEG